MTLKIWNGSAWANVTPGTGGTGGPVTAPSFVGPYTIGTWAGGTHPALWRTDITQDTTGKYAVMSDTINTYVNAQAGGLVDLRANHAQIMTVGAAGITIPTVGVTMTSGSLTLTSGQANIASARIGLHPAHGSTWPAFWNANARGAESTTYGVMQNDTGVTLLNANSGQYVGIRNGNNSIARVTSTALVLEPNVALVTNGSLQNYGAVTAQGDKNGWSGVNFRNASGANIGTLMVQATASGANSGWGMYSSADNAWLTYWQGGVYQGLSATTGSFTGTVNIAGGDLQVTLGRYLYVYNSNNTQYGRMVATGNFHIDSIGGGNTYLNWFGGGRVLIGNGAGAATGYFSSGPITASGITQGAWGDVGLSALSDIITTRSGNTTGVIYFDSPTAHYLFWSGSQYVMPSASASIGGVTVGSAAWAKESIAELPVGDGLRVLRGLAPRRFYWQKGRHADQGPQAGFVREEVAAVAPESVTEDFAGANGEQHPGGYRLDHLLAYLWQAVRELTDEVDSLKAKVAA